MKECAGAAGILADKRSEGADDAVLEQCAVQEEMT